MLCLFPGEAPYQRRAVRDPVRRAEKEHLLEFLKMVKLK